MSVSQPMMPQRGDVGTGMKSAVPQSALQKRRSSDSCYPPLLP
jgi:hypothetical protein